MQGNQSCKDYRDDRTRVRALEGGGNCSIKSPYPKQESYPRLISLDSMLTDTEVPQRKRERLNFSYSWS